MEAEPATPQAPVAPVPEVKPVEQVKPQIDATQVTFFVWILYHLNIITRIQVKDFLQIIKEGKWPDDVVKYLSDEVKKL